MKAFLFCKYRHQSQRYFSALETLLMRSTNPWYLLTYLLTYSQPTIWEGRKEGFGDWVDARAARGF